LGDALAERTRIGNLMAVKVSVSAGELATSGDPRIKALATDLIKTVEDTINKYPIDTLPPDQAATIRLARATAANAEGRFDDALTLVPGEVAQRVNALDVSLAQTRAEAYYGKRAWAEAKGELDRVIALRPENPFPRLLAGTCNLHLQRYDDAERNYTAVIAGPATAVPNQAVWRIAALNNRGSVRAIQRMLADAEADFTSGIREERQRPLGCESRRGLATLLVNRAFVLAQQNLTKRADADRVEATTIVKTIDAGCDVKEIVDVLAALAPEVNHRNQTPRKSAKPPTVHKDTTNCLICHRT